ncbi:MAG TPA: NADP-dependent oxidoreductase [Herpetosiphonaceae bacterium]
MATIKAVRIHAYGGPEQLVYEDAPKPAPADDELLVRVHAAAINPVDWKVRLGYLQEFIPYELPLILGWDVSGVVEAVGSAVTDFKVGDEIYSRPDLTRSGAYTEYIVLRASEAAHKPRSIDHIHAAAVPLAALTAWASLFDSGQLEAGQKVLIHAAAGGVGTVAVQLAKWKGAHVIGTASGRNRDFLQQLGVDEFVDYTSTKFEDVARDVDVVFDTIGGETQERSWQVLKPGGILVSVISPPSQETADQHGVRQGYVFIDPNGPRLAEIAGLIDDGKIKPIVETVLPLRETRQAHELSESGHARGKIVLRVAE